jgi:hypothetical protein
MPLFDVAILQKPTRKEAEEGQGEKLVYGPKAVIARDINSAPLVAIMDAELPKDIDKTRLEVLCRPFA